MAKFLSMLDFCSWRGLNHESLDYGSNTLTTAPSNPDPIYILICNTLQTLSHRLMSIIFRIKTISFYWIPILPNLLFYWIPILPTLLFHWIPILPTLLFYWISIIPTLLFYWIPILPTLLFYWIPILPTLLFYWIPIIPTLMFY